MSSNPYAPSAIPLELAPVAPAKSLQLATRGERFAGAIIDNLLLLALVMPIMFAVGIGLGVAGAAELPEVVFEMMGWVTGVVVFLSLNSYLLATRGQTIGKVVMKTQIVDRATDSIPAVAPLILKRYAWLWLIVWVPGIGNLITLLDSVLIFRESRACLHDDVAGTKVIKLDRPWSKL